VARERVNVSVVGLGLMGSAIARTLNNAGYQVTVWNRTREKAAPFRGICHPLRVPDMADLWPDPHELHIAPRLPSLKPPVS
jgi:glutamyl-tRNA reductase